MLVLLLASWVLAAPPAPEPPRKIAVVCIGPDASLAGEMQSQLELRLAKLGPSIEVVSGDPTAAIRRLPEVDAETEETVKRFLEEAKLAFAEAQPARALDRLSAAATLRRTLGGGEQEEKVRIALSRAAAFLALGADLDAEAEVTEAIVLSPDLVVDPAQYSEALVEMVASLRTKLPGSATVILENLPANASVRVDGRSVGKVFRVLRGPHRLEVSASGRRGWSKTIEVKENLVLSAGLPLSLDDTTAKALNEAIWWGAFTAEEDPALEHLFRRTGAEWLLVVATAPGKVRAVLVPGARTVSFVHGAEIPIDGFTAMRLADLALVSARPDPLVGSAPTRVSISK